MISSVFIHRPRLAAVISIVITIAGLIAIKVIPIAQFPDIVPPQVAVQATYPGANAAAVEASVAQVVESAVNGVDKACPSSNALRQLSACRTGGSGSDWFVV